MKASRGKCLMAICSGSLVLAAGAAFGSGLTALASIREEVVLAGSVISGKRLDMNRFADNRPAQTLLDEVRKTWSQRPAPIHVVQRDGWLTMTQVVGSTVESFEVRQKGAGAEGRRLRWHRGDQNQTEVGKWLQATLPPDSRVIDRMTHSDGGRQMTTMVAMTGGDVAHASQDVVAALKQKGFRSEPRGMPSFTARGMVFFMVRGSEDVAVTISDHDGQRAIVMHWGRTVQ